MVLAGIGSLDYRDLEGWGEPQVPTLMASTPQGLFGCDNCLADLDGDGAPDLPIGRIPAATSDALGSYVAKLAAFEAARDPLDTAGAVLLADRPDPAAGDFPADSEQVAGLLPPDLALERLYLDRLDLVTARARLIAALNQGTGWVNYVGHGGSDRLSDQGLLTIDDLGALVSTGRQPVMSALTCATNRFEIPGYPPLGAHLVLDPDGGALGVWSPTGLSLNAAAAELNRSLAEALYLQGAPTLGEAVQRALQDNTGRFEVPASMLRIYSLIGDPALPLNP